MATFIDNFNRADENPLANGDWDSVLNSGLRLISNQAAGNGGANASLVKTSTISLTNDQLVKATWRTPNDFDDVSLLLRCDALGNGYSLFVLKDATRVIIRRLAAWGATDLQSILGITPVDGDIFELRAEGTTLKAFRNGSQIGSDQTDATHAGGGAGLHYVLGNSNGTRIDDFEASDIIPGPSITNVDGDDNISPGQADVKINGSLFGAVRGAGSVSLLNAAETIAVDQQVGDVDWSNTQVNIPSVIQSGLEYSATHKLRLTDNNSVSDTITITLSPGSGLSFHVINSPVADNTSLFFGMSPAPVNGDQVEYPTATDQGNALLVSPDGTFTISGAGGGEQTFTIRIWDQSDSTWSSQAIVTVNGVVQDDTRKKRRKQTYTALMYHRKYWRGDFIDEDEK